MDSMKSARSSRMASALSSRANSMSANVKDRVSDLIQRLIQRAFLQYMALFVVAGLGFWLFLHYATNWFNDEQGNKKIWAQAGTAFAFALVICLIAYFTRLL